MWVYEEMIEGQKLTEIINTKHENVKYLPGIKLPENIIAVPDLLEATNDADILVFVVPHQFVNGLCDQLKGHVKKSAFAISLIKGVDASHGGMKLVSSCIYERLDGIDVSVLMGANIAGEVAQEMFCEATIGCRNEEYGRVFYELFHTNYFRITVTKDASTVEICGALKNIIAVGAGFCDGLEYGSNTKAAVIRIGMQEMLKFSKTFYKGVEMATFLESCGVADVITTCFGGRNRKVSEAYARAGGQKSIEELEKEMLNGQKLQGPLAAKEVHVLLKEKGQEDQYPLFTAVYRICYEGVPISDMLKHI